MENLTAFQIGFAENLTEAEKAYWMHSRFCSLVRILEQEGSSTLMHQELSFMSGWLFGFFQKHKAKFV